MRDGDIYNMLAATNKRISMIYKQLVFVDTRLNAFESAFKEPLTRLKAVFSPKSLIKRVDAYQIEYMKQHDAELKTKMDAAKEEMNKPKITLLSPANVAVKTNGL